MDHQKDVDILLGCQSSQHGGDLVLKVELLITSCLITQHELHIIQTDHLNVVRVDGVLQSFKH